MTPNVLYVEDNPTNYRLVERLLTAEGFRVIPARDGLEGLARAVEEKERLDLILMDINLPEIDGYEATERLRAIPGFEKVPILAVTVNSMPGDRCRSLAAGCDGFISKPIDVSTFADQVRSFLNGARERLEPAEENRYLHEHNSRLVERLEESLRTLKKTRESVSHGDRLASVGEMAAGLMHELRNPLSAISFLAEFLLAEGSEGEKRREYLERIVDHVERIRKLSDGVRSFVRPDGASKGWVEVAEAVEDAAAMCGAEAARLGADIRLAVEPDLPRVWAAEGQIHHLLVNLIRNGLDASAQTTAPGGRGRVRILAECDPASDWVIVEVSDSGPGIPEESRERIFEPFFTTKPRERGTGLGLYLVRQIADDIGATVTVGRGPDGGASFVVRIPAAVEPAVAFEEQVVG